MTVESAGVKEGDILAGKYRVDRVLGVGGMGVVVAAHHLQLDDRVAIKFLLPETLQNKEAVARFAREARAAVKIKSDHVARVTDVGTMENGAPYMVMEYLEGDDLSGWVAARGALPVGLAVDFVLQACEAIAEAHTLGIVHRDLKPANLFVARTPGGGQRVKVLDFGISKLTLGQGATSATKTSALMGSPLYMSPEQMQSSRDVDARSDLWALGVILYELVAGASPFTADSMPELVLKVVGSQPQPLTSIRPDAPPGLEAVVMKCLEKDRTRRFQTVGEFATALAPFGSARARTSADRISEVMMAAGMSTNSLELSAPTVSRVPGTGTTADFGGTAPGGSRKSRPILLSAIVLVVLLGAGGVATIGFRMATRTAPGSTVPATPTPEPSAAPAASAPNSASAAPVPAVAPADVAPVVAASASLAAGERPQTRPSASATPPVAASARALRTTGTRSGAGPKPKPSAAAAPAPTAKPSPTSLIDDRR